MRLEQEAERGVQKERESGGPEPSKSVLKLGNRKSKEIRLIVWGSYFSRESAAVDTSMSEC